MGYPMNIDVHSATPHDSNCAKQVLSGLKEKFPRLIRILADRGYQEDLQQWFHRHTGGCLLGIVKPSDGAKGFRVQQWRWVVERSFAWLGKFRRLSKDYEITVSSAKAFIQLAFTKIMLKKLIKDFT
jgi:putative transposase